MKFRHIIYPLVTGMMTFIGMGELLEHGVLDGRIYETVNHTLNYVLGQANILIEPIRNASAIVILPTLATTGLVSLMQKD